MQGGLRMRGRGLPGYRPPGWLRQRLVEIGQHHRAVRQTGDRGEQARRGRHRAGRAGGDHRAGEAAGLEAPALGLEHAVAKIGRVAFAALGQDRRPGLGDDVEEAGVELPDLVEAGGVETPQPLRCHALGLHLVEQAGEVAGEAPGFGERRRHQSRLGRVEPQMLPVGGLAPLRDQPGQDQPALQWVDRRDARQHLAGAGDQRRLGLVDIAERHDARQEQRPAAELFRQDRREGAGGALGRQIERRARQRRRVAGVMGLAEAPGQ